MGIIADRIALKTLPLYALAKEISKCAIDNASTEDSADYGSLYEAVERALETTSGEHIPALLDAISGVLAVRTDAQEIMQYVMATFDTVCTTQDVGVDSVGHLVAVPLVFLAKTVSWDIKNISEKSDEIAQVMRDYELIDEDASINVLPRILSSLEANALGYPETREMLKQMSEQNHAGALAVVDASNEANGVVRSYTRPAGSNHEDALSSGILVLYVSTEDSEPFPLAALLNAELSAADELAAIDTKAADARATQAVTEVKDIFVAAGKVLAGILDIAEVTVLQAPEDWFSGPACVRKLERINAFYKWVRASAEQYSSGDPRMLLGAIATQHINEEGYLQVSAYLAQGAQAVATFDWYISRDETFDGCLSNLYDALRDSGVSPLRMAPVSPVDEDSDDEDADPGAGLEFDEMSFSSPAKAGTLLH